MLLHLKTLTKNQCFSIKIDSVAFLAKGTDHAVFTYGHQQIIIFQLHKDESTKVQFVEMMEDLYEHIMANFFPNLQKVRWPKQICKVLDTNQQKFQEICENLEAKNQFNKFKISRNSRRVYITTNIFQNDYFNVIIQFKPKSITPDIYMPGSLHQIADKFSIQYNFLLKIIKQSSNLEKTRWFKKTIQKQDNKKSKFSQNPLKTFGIDTNPPNFLNNKTYFKKMPELNFQEAQMLNLSIIQNLKSNNFLLNLHQIQSLYQDSPERIPMDIIKKINAEKFNKQFFFQSVKSKLISILREKPINIQSHNKFLQSFTCVNTKKQQVLTEYEACVELFFFLLSLTWRDVSIVYRSISRGGKIENPQYWVIDDTFKTQNKVIENIHKDAKFLQAYIKFKLK